MAGAEDIADCGFLIADSGLEEVRPLYDSQFRIATEDTESTENGTERISLTNHSQCSVPSVANLLMSVHVRLRKLRRMNATQRFDCCRDVGLSIGRCGVAFRTGRTNGQVQFVGAFDDGFGRLERAVPDAVELNVGADIAQFLLNFAQLVTDIDLLLAVVNGDQPRAGEDERVRTWRMAAPSD